METKAGYRTKAREQLLTYMKSSHGEHHTAAEIREHFEAEGAPIGMATIYRQLERFVDEGVIQKYTLGPGESACNAYIEKTEQCVSHFHCRCEDCGRLIHLDCEELREIRTHLARHHGFEWNVGKTVFYGLCDQCRKSRMIRAMEEKTE